MNDILDEIRYQYYNRTMLKSKICFMVGVISLAIYCFSRINQSFHIAILALAILIVFPLYFSVVEKRIKNKDLYDIACRVYKSYNDRDQRYKILKAVLNEYEVEKLKALHLMLKASQEKSFLDNLYTATSVALSAMAVMISLMPSDADPKAIIIFKVYMIFCLFIIGGWIILASLVHSNSDKYILFCIEDILEED